MEECVLMSIVPMVILNSEGKKRRANHWMILEKNFCRYIALKGHFVIKFYKDRVMWRAGKLKGCFVV